MTGIDTDYIQLSKEWNIWLECRICGRQTITHEFQGESRSEVIKEARDDGWIINFNNGTAVHIYCKEGLGEDDDRV